MEEIWNYNVGLRRQGQGLPGRLGQRLLEYDIKTGSWKAYLDPDGEMEIDLYRDDGIIHVIVTGASPVDDVLWISTYFGSCRYDGRHWRGFYTPGDRAAQRLHQQRQGPQRPRALVRHGQGRWASSPTSPSETPGSPTPATPTGTAAARPSSRGTRRAEDRRHAGRRAPQLHHRRRHRRQRRLGRHGQGPRLGHRRGLLRRRRRSAALRVRASGAEPTAPGQAGEAGEARKAPYA